MKKTLIALAALAVSGASFAQSSVTIYGTLDVGYGTLASGDFGMQNGETYQTAVSGGSNRGVATVPVKDGFNSTSVIGFKGTEDLGGGLKANFNLQTGGLDLGTGGTPLAFGRESWVGLSGGFGSVLFGRSGSVANKSVGRYDLNGTSGSSALALAGVSAVGSWYASSRRSDQMQYTSPVMGGFTAMLGLTLKADSTDNGIAVASTAKDRVSLALNWESGPLSIGLVGESANTSAQRDASAFGVSYDFGAVKVAAGYNYREQAGVAGYNNAGGNLLVGTGGGEGYHVGAVVPVGAFNVGLQYANNKDTNAKATEVFMNYSLSKRTRLYLDYVGVTDVNAVAAVAASGNNYGVSAVPANPTQYGFGIIHSF